MLSTLAIYFPGGWEWIVILIVALLIFGKRLPDVGKSLGHGIVEFKKGLKGMKEEMDSVNNEVDEAVNHEDEEPARPPKELAAEGTDSSETPYAPEHAEETRRDEAKAQA